MAALAEQRARHAAAAGGAGGAAATSATTPPPSSLPGMTHCALCNRHFPDASFREHRRSVHNDVDKPAVALPKALPLPRGGVVRLLHERSLTGSCGPPVSLHGARRLAPSAAFRQGACALRTRRLSRLPEALGVSASQVHINKRDGRLAVFAPHVNRGLHVFTSRDSVHDGPEFMCPLAYETGPATSMSFAPEGSGVLLSASLSGYAAPGELVLVKNDLQDCHAPVPSNSMWTSAWNHHHPRHGLHCVSTGASNGAQVWDTHARPLAFLESGAVTAQVFVEDGLINGARGGSLSHWDFRVAAASLGNVYKCRSAVWSLLESGAYGLVAADLTGAVVGIDRRMPMFTLTEYQAAAPTARQTVHRVPLAATEDCSLLFGGTLDGCVAAWEATSGKLVWRSEAFDESRDMVQSLDVANTDEGLSLVACAKDLLWAFNLKDDE